MSLFGGLDDGVVESIPTLIDEDLEDLFAGGEDLFELLDERVATPLVIPPAPVVADAPVIVDTPVVESGEPSGYTAPVFFPFGKIEPTAPQLKLSGVSSFKKINSRLLQGGALSDKEEADAIRELERALGVLGHQRRFLKEHKAGLEKWTSAVYGISLSTETGAPADAVSIGYREGHGAQHPLVNDKATLREVRVSLKCKGAKRRMEKQPLIAQVDQTWSPRNDHSKSTKKRSSGKTEAEKPAKRGKPPSAPKVGQAVVIGTTSVPSTAEEISQDKLAKKKGDGAPDAPGAPDQALDWLEGRPSLPRVTGRQPLKGDESVKADSHMGRTSFPSISSEPVAETAAETGIRRDCLEDDADVMRQRLTQALVASAAVDGGAKSDKQRKPCAEKTGRRKSCTDTVHLLDVTRLSLAQRVLVQLNCAGLIASGASRGW